MALGEFDTSVTAKAPAAASSTGTDAGSRFIVYCTILAAVVEGLHMISKPVFD